MKNEFKQPTKTKNIPIALFDSLENFQDEMNVVCLGKPYNQQDFTISLKFLNAYIGSQGTFNAYRREIERLLQWCALITNKSLKDVKCEDIERFMEFCQKPPKTWIGETKSARFIVKEGQRIPNPLWRPFVVTISKIARRQGAELDKNNFKWL